jgi:hypothetical protein
MSTAKNTLTHNTVHFPDGSVDLVDAFTIGHSACQYSFQYRNKSFKTANTSTQVAIRKLYWSYSKILGFQGSVTNNDVGPQRYEAVRGCN